MIKELVTENQPVAIYHQVMTDFNEESYAVNCGQILMGDKGTYTLYINYLPVELQPGKIVVMHPGDVVRTEGAEKDFQVSCLAYDASILQEASFQMESAVENYVQDIFTSSDPGLYSFVHRLLNIIEPLLSEVSTPCIRQVTIMQLRTFFLVCFDRMAKDTDRGQNLNPRKEELFDRFFSLLVTHHRHERSVAFYADKMNMTPRYLNQIVRAITGKSTKLIIDDYVMTQLKLTIQTSYKTIKEIAWEYGFDSLPFFNDYFKRHTRVTPQMFRKQ